MHRHHLPKLKRIPDGEGAPLPVVERCCFGRITTGRRNIGHKRNWSGGRNASLTTPGFCERRGPVALSPGACSLRYYPQYLAWVCSYNAVRLLGNKAELHAVYAQRLIAFAFSRVWGRRTLQMVVKTTGSDRRHVSFSDKFHEKCLRSRVVRGFYRGQRCRLGGGSVSVDNWGVWYIGKGGC